MSDDKFDVIVVGGGIAGTVASYLLAQEGLTVILVERGNNCGSKNVTGGRLYSYSLEAIMPGFAQEAPVERLVTKEKVSMLTKDGSVTLDIQSDKFNEPGKNSYTVLRSTFDRWLCDKAEEAGVMPVTGYRVDDIIVRDGKVCGIVSNDEEMEADVVILADGVNSLLAEKLGMKEPVKPDQVSVGAKEVISLDKDIIEERFGLKENEGCAWSFFGSNTDGLHGGGFLYTNKESISLGLTCNLKKLSEGDKTLVQLIEEFKAHPVVAPLIKGGELMEYSAHLEPEAGCKMIPELYRDGIVVIGDAAGLSLNLGHMIRGMDFAVISAQCAAQAVLAAKEKEDFSAEALKLYQELLEESIVMKDLRTREGFLNFLENPRLYKEYPQMTVELFEQLFSADGAEAKPIHAIVGQYLDGAELFKSDMEEAKKL